LKRLEARVMPARLQEALRILPKGSVLGRYDDISSTGFVIVAAVDDDQVDRLVRELVDKGISDFILVTVVDRMYKKSEPVTGSGNDLSGE